MYRRFHSWRATGAGGTCCPPFVELDRLAERIRSSFETAVEQIGGFEREYGDRRHVLEPTELTARLARCEYVTYDVFSYLYMLDQIADKA